MVWLFLYSTRKNVFLNIGHIVAFIVLFCLCNLQKCVNFVREFDKRTKVMKRLIYAIVCVIMAAVAVSAHEMNDKADNICGEYLTDRGGSKSKVRVYKNTNGTYTAQVFWVERPNDANGVKRKDVKNPDKSLRNVDIDKVVLVNGLQYKPKDKKWGGAKIYDPTKGIRVNASAEFTDDATLKLRGTILGIGATLYWKKIK